MPRTPIARLPLAAAVVLSLTGTTAHAETLLAFDFDTPDGAFDITPETASTAIIGTTWLDIDATLTDYTGNPGRALGARGFDDGNAFVLVVEIAPGAVLTLESLTFDQRASASGATALEVLLDDVSLSSNMTTTDYDTVAVDLAPRAITDIAFLEIAGSGASSAAGTFRIDNFALTGTVVPAPVPLPAPAAAFAVALGSLSRARRAAPARC